MSPSRCLLVVAMCVAMSSQCGGGPTAPDQSETCAGYSAWQTSAYVLPYSAGLSYRVIQGNCSAPGNGHRGAERYGYDFDMVAGTPFTAARSGTVAHVEASHVDGQIGATGLDNYIVVRHDDGTHGLYGHITHDGSSVSIGDVIVAGQALGRSGNTGNTNNIPHLHFSVHSCDPVANGSAACPSQPVTFRNTEPNPGGLLLNHTYLALPF